VADVSGNLKDWSTTAASNNPSGSTAVGTGLDDNLRELQKVVRQDLASKGSDIASASTTDLGAVAGLIHDITGTTTIQSFGTVAAGIWKIIKFEGALTLTHNATSLILPGGANITTADGDIGIFVSEGSGNWRCVTYFRAANSPTQDASDTAKGVIEIAVQSEMEAGSDTAKAVTPGRQHYHPSAAKGWVMANFDTTSDASYNVEAISDVGAGVMDISWGTDFSAATYSVVATGKVAFSGTSATTITTAVDDTSFGAGTTRVYIVRMSDFTNVDASDMMVVAFGDH
jgi:hypothetical protein